MQFYMMQNFGQGHVGIGWYERGIQYMLYLTMIYLPSGDGISFLPRRYQKIFLKFAEIEKPKVL